MTKVTPGRADQGGRGRARGPQGRLSRALLLPLMPLLLSACSLGLEPSGPPRESLRPVQRSAAAVPAPSRAASQALEAYYETQLSEALARDLMRRDGGGPDAGFTAEDLARNFARIAFFDERSRARLADGTEAPGKLLRWERPVRVKPVFGDSVGEAQRASDRATLRPLLRRLARTTGHPVSFSGESANFHLLVMAETDRPEMLSIVSRLVPNISAVTLATLRNLPRDVPCLVMGFADERGGVRYGSAIALVRAELPPRMREACFHEEIAQGLGLRNDSPEARPSVFNDDEEFALLTEQDEMMLSMLYDARLRSGMSLEEARPLIPVLAAERRPGPLASDTGAEELRVSESR
ncbi:Protein of unknown function [Pseudooceanicola antarcticus]|uniref:DUF2927 domain-containing protein n=1 Tax=Pseudooceanicola antarcticus TaxID=1247613 RepID=A0A285INP8_9RHOB|nr:DUF2927 domain-containing protein [Pseudooceanicola antarcticus]PJE28626.1 DUF2927 domain-containing protein [Pseudooceanicola antarcticus]SNY48726.1 Protein of unknown function [Pseudooceanicola antarcticus]